MNNLATAPYVVNSYGNNSLIDISGAPGSTAYDNTYGAITWLPNIPFHATLEFTGELVGNGNRFELRDITTGTMYNIFPRDLLNGILLDRLDSGEITGTWMVVKRNTAYGLQLV